MDGQARRELAEFRRKAGPVENQVIDDFLHGEMDRGSFIRLGAVFGLSLPTLRHALAAAGESPLRSAARHGLSAAQTGGRLRLAIDGAPYGAIEPYTFNSLSGVDIAAPAGEYLTRVTGQGVVAPELAVAWTPNADASRWTIKLRPGVTFQTGQPMTAHDVVATYKLLTDPAKGSTALTNFKGVLAPEGVSAGPDQQTVIFDLVTPTAFFPYLISSATYEAIILPASYKIGTFTSKPQGTGPFVMTSYTTAVSATYDRFDGWWGGRPRLAGIDSTVYTSVTSLDAALLSGAADLADFAGDPSLFGKPQIRIYKINAAGQEQVAMRVDTPPWNDYRVRQALAYAIDRVALNAKVNLNVAALGNDYCFAPLYPYTVPLPQRKQDLSLAKQLLAAAGHPHGFSATLTTGNEATKVAIAQVVQADARKVGIDLKLDLLPPTAYYASGPSTPWLNAPLTVTTWASRPTVGPYLTATLMSGGVWNATHYANPHFDSIAKAFLGAIALADQRKYAKQLESILQHDTPNLVLAWPQQLDAGSVKVAGFHLEPIGMSLGNVYFKS
jgi:peptide/nickel transport system substrate-binding protein